MKQIKETKIAVIGLGYVGLPWQDFSRQNTLLLVTT